MYNLFKIGDSEINDFKIGTNQVDKIYLGTQLLWKKSTIYGWSVNPSISDPYQAVTYLEDAIGKTPSKMFPTYIIDTDFGVWGVDSDGYPYVLHDSWVDVYRLYTPMIDINKGQTITINNPSIAGKTVQIWFFTIDSEGKRVTHTPDAVALPYTFTSSDNTKFFMSIKYQDDSAITQFNMSYTLNDFSYGDWNNAFFRPKPCMLKYDGTVDYYLDDFEYERRIFDKNDNIAINIGIENGGINNSTGQPGEHEGYVRSSDFIPITETNIYIGPEKILRNSDFPYNNGTVTIMYVYEYNINKSFIHFGYTDFTYNGSTPYTLQNNTKYIKLTYGANMFKDIITPDIVGNRFIVSYSPIGSDISNMSYNGNAMIEWPLIWYKFESIESKGYRPVEYIKSNGTQHIITDIVGLNAATDYIECEMSFGALNYINDGALLFGCGTKTENYWTLFGVYFGATDNNTFIRNNAFYFDPNYSTGGGGTIKRMRVETNNDYTSRMLLRCKTPVSTITNMSSNVTYSPIVRDNFDALNLSPIDFAQKSRFCVFAAEYYIDNDNYMYYYCRRETSCYGVRIYRNNSLIHNLIPTERMSDNELGLYDTITDKFHINAGTGTFTKGNYIDAGYGWFYCSDTQIDSSYNCWCNYDCYNNVTPHFYTPIYNTTISNNKMRSLSGLALTTPNGSGTTTGRLELDTALANNVTPDVEWYSGTWADRTLISALMVLISKNLNNQSVFGNGISTQSAKESYVTGTLNDKGLFYGSLTDYTTAVKVFGMENFYGCVGQRIAGLVGTDIGYAYKLTYGQADGSNIDTYNDNGLGYKFVSNQPTASSVLNWVDKMQFGDNGILPVSVSGGANTYWADSFWSGTNYAVIGKNDVDSNNATGSLSIDLTNSFNTASWNISGSLSCKPVLRLPNIDTNTLRIHNETIIDYKPNSNSTVEIQLYIKDSSHLPAYNELTGRILLSGSTAISIDDSKIYMLDVDNEWKVMYEHNN